jgi:hypothetical protein
MNLNLCIVWYLIIIVSFDGLFNGVENRWFIVFNGLTNESGKRFF